MSVELVLEDLKLRYGDRKVLYARDIAEIIGQSPARVQRLMRTHSLPFPLINVGRHFGASLYAVAQWLAQGESLLVGSDQAPGASQAKTRKAAVKAQTAGHGQAVGGDSGHQGTPSGTSLVAQVMAMRHDAARFIADRLEIGRHTHLTRHEFKFWRSVVKHLLFAPTATSSWVLRVVVRTTSVLEQTTMQRVYDADGLEHALRDSATYISDDEPGVLHLSLKNSVSGKTVLEVMRQGEHKFMIIDKVGFSAMVAHPHQQWKAMAH